MGVQNRLLVMKYTILFTTFVFALASSKESDYYSNLSDDTFCQYVGTWVDRAEKLTPGFKWNIDQMCKDGKYQRWQRKRAKRRSNDVFCVSFGTAFRNPETSFSFVFDKLN